ADLGRERADAEAAQARGYYLPDEDERLREVYARYLALRAVLWGTVEALAPIVDTKEELAWEQRLRAFGVGFCAAALLVRAGTFLVELARVRPVVWRKLDEAEGRYGIERKSFTRIYERLASTRWMWRCYEAAQFYRVHREDLEEAMRGPGYREVFELVRGEEPLIEARKRDYLQRNLDYRLYDFKRRHVSGYRKVMFHLFRLSGSAIADLKQPFVKAAGVGKRVTESVWAEVGGLLRPGDVVVTRHDDALSNLFLPGFWPHAALYIGSLEEREALGVAVEEGRRARSGGVVRFLESKKDGVLFRPLEETLAVDAFTVLRPRLGAGVLAGVLGKALSHEGKLYDFLFDFRAADRLACTELVYRSFHGVEGAAFWLSERAGRLCLSAEDLLDQALGGGVFEVLALYGVGEDRLWTGEEARLRLAGSYGR
ncbi:MAG: YiiX/YebB-like N1pC/P60 family cysteine hydrolase, partial [Verrucomicrobia bacterium]|nr:YiiX/YebB-like N1pC/P60 family cysteine hydrolase [Verrucomicrobiota bacterium]